MSDARYQRQQQVPALGIKSQQKLAGAHVLIVGAGGLGSPVSLYLAGAGVGQITVIDGDIVSQSNLHRQILFQEDHVGASKAAFAKQRLSALNSEIKVNAINTNLNTDNVKRLVQQVTVVVDAADNFFASYLLSDVCLKQRVPLVSASVLGTKGYVGIFCGTEDMPAPSLRAVFPAPPAAIATCNTAGVTGPSVGIIGSYQAQETLKVIIEDTSQLRGKLLNFDLWDYRQSVIDFSVASEPECHAELLSIQALPVEHILLDVRSTQEYQQDTLAPPSMNIPLDALAQHLDQLPKEKTIVCVCHSGQRALHAAQFLLDQGYLNAKVTMR